MSNLRSKTPLKCKQVITRLKHKHESFHLQQIASSFQIAINIFCLLILYTLSLQKNKCFPYKIPKNTIVRGEFFGLKKKHKIDRMKWQ